SVRPVPTIIAAIIFVVAGAMVVKQRLELTQLGYEIGKKDREIRGLEEAARNMRTEVSRQVNHSEIKRLVQEYSLPLAPPSDGDAQAKRAKG
ncbi:MAG: hypothetical protein KDB07_10195, partial [Planctomycetes bacterium]|nr:hypothetical protein [Planctomycetota bacterium]